MTQEANVGLPERTKIDLTTLLNWRRVPQGLNLLKAGSLCRHKRRAVAGTLDGFYGCSLDGTRHDDRWVILFDEGDLLLFLNVFDPLFQTPRAEFISHNGQGIFMSRLGIVRGSFRDVEIQAP